MKKVLLLINSLLVLGFTLRPAYAQAPGTVSLVVSPPSFELTSSPGKVVTNVIKVTNPTDNSVSVQLKKKDFVANGEEGGVDLSDDSDSTYSLAKWITVEPESAVILPKSTTSFTYTITVPKDAEPGGHFGSILFSVGDNKTLSGSGASVITEVGSLILMNLSGKTNEMASISSFDPNLRISEYGPVKLEYRVLNSGNVHIKPVGKIVIKDMLGRTVYENAVDARNVLPASVRKNDFVWDAKWLLGKFRAQLTLNYGSESKVLMSETQFWVVPYKELSLISLALVIIVLYFIKNGKRIKKALSLIMGRD